MKRIISAAFALGLALVLCACGETASEPASPYAGVWTAVSAAFGEEDVPISEVFPDGLVLELSALREDALPPCAAGDLLLRGLTGGQLLWTSRSGETRSAAFAGRDGETVTLWRDGTGAPVYAEIARGGSPELSLRLSNWQTKE